MLLPVYDVQYRQAVKAVFTRTPCLREGNSFYDPFKGRARSSILNGEPFALLGSPVFRKAATLAVVRASRCRLTLCTARYGGRKGNSGSKQAAAISTHSQAISSTLEFRFILFFYFFSSLDVQKVESSVFGVVFLAISCVGGVGFFCASCCWVGVFCLVGCRCLFGGLCFGGRFLVFFLLSFPERVTVISIPGG